MKLMHYSLANNNFDLNKSCQRDNALDYFDALLQNVTAQCVKFKGPRMSNFANVKKNP